MPTDDTPLDYFSPHRADASPARARGCYTCTFFLGQYFGGHVVCERDAPVRESVVGQPLAACAFWMREPGADDE